MKIKAIEEIKEFLESRNSWELIQIMVMLSLLVGLTAGYVIGEYRTTEKIGGQLQKHVIKEGNGIYPENYFSIDGTYLFYLVQTNITIEDYKKSIMR